MYDAQESRGMGLVIDGRRMGRRERNCHVNGGKWRGARLVDGLCLIRNVNRIPIHTVSPYAQNVSS